MNQVKQMLVRLKKPSVVLSIVSQISALVMLMGFNINESKIMTIATAVCSIFVLLGIMQNPDTKKKGYGDDLLTCSGCGVTSAHTEVNGQMVCSGCGAVQGVADADADEIAQGDPEVREALEDMEQVVSVAETVKAVAKALQPKAAAATSGAGAASRAAGAQGGTATGTAEATAGSAQAAAVPDLPHGPVDHAYMQ